MTKNIITTRKGFTLMEILFVVLVIALVVSFALPAIRSVRFDIKNSQAKAALKKFAEARHSYYEASRGGQLTGVCNGIETTKPDKDYVKNLVNQNCSNKAFSGIPGQASDVQEVSQLFACGMLDWKDFVGLPYQFIACSTGSPCTPDQIGGSRVYVKAVGLAGSGDKYQWTDANSYYLYVTTSDMQVREAHED